nr:hypothetical protein [uncultured Flavobacterium sp.]
MNILISVKQLGKKHASLNEKTIELDTSDSVITARTLIELVVKQQVSLFNASSFEFDEYDAIHLPKENYLPLLTDTGKVGFGAVYNHQKPDLEKVTQTALQAFEDGLYAVFYGDDELEGLDTQLDLNQDKPFTFIRLTFLAGSYW